jgi:hypothetical protein
MLCKKKGVDIIAAAEMNCNRRVSRQEQAYLFEPVKLARNIYIFFKKSSR